jgi:hypothetical protein
MVTASLKRLRIAERGDPGFDRLSPSGGGGHPWSGGAPPPLALSLSKGGLQRTIG